MAELTLLKGSNLMASNGPDGLPRSAESELSRRPILCRIRNAQKRLAAGFTAETKLSAHNDPQPILKAGAAELLEMRRRRERMLSPDLVDGPSWVMLLHAYVSPNSVMMTKELLNATSVPQTTAFRWLRYLEQEGYLEKAEHPSLTDNRATFYRLTPDGRVSLERVLEDMLRE